MLNLHCSFLGLCFIFFYIFITIDDRTLILTRNTSGFIRGARRLLSGTKDLKNNLKCVMVLQTPLIQIRLEHQCGFTYLPPEGY